MSYNYFESIKEDVKNYINNNIDLKEYERKELKQKLNDDLFFEDSVTGNGSGSYTFNAYEAKENLCHNMDLLKDAADCFGEDIGDLIGRGAEVCDVTIRCYLLPQAISEALDEYDDNDFLDK